MRERINWPIWLWALLLLLDLAITMAVGVAMDDRGLLITALVLLAFTCYLWLISRLEISVAEGWLRVGSAKLELSYIDSVVILDEQAMRRERGINLDPRAYLAIRFWVKGGVKIILKDPRDSTPYWLVSSKKNAEIARAISG